MINGYYAAIITSKSVIYGTMKTDTEQPSTPERTTFKIGDIIKHSLKVWIVLGVSALVLFFCAGTANWGVAWLFVGLMTINLVVMTILLDPALTVERDRLGEGYKKWDLPLVLIMARFGPLGTLIVAGLDERFQWSLPFSLATTLVSVIALMLGMVLANWAMLSNQFFSGVVRIQKDRGHRVVDAGPYQFVRHPGYAGTVLYNLAIPFLLNSVWAMIPVVLTVFVTIIRTGLEDKTLRYELEGYDAYSRRVRYRLVPGLW